MVTMEPSYDPATAGSADQIHEPLSEWAEGEPPRDEMRDESALKEPFIQPEQPIQNIAHISGPILSE
jgi:hypothetical protein